MHVWTETPVTAIWEQLRYFKASANVRNLLTGAVGSRRQALWPAGSDTDARADEIAAAVAQADEYFQAARSVGPPWIGGVGTFPSGLAIISSLLVLALPQVPVLGIGRPIGILANIVLGIALGVVMLRWKEPNPPVAA